MTLTVMLKTLLGQKFLMMKFLVLKFLMLKFLMMKFLMLKVLNLLLFLRDLFVELCYSGLTAATANLDVPAIFQDLGYIDPSKAKLRIPYQFAPPEVQPQNVAAAKPKPKPKAGARTGGAPGQDPTPKGGGGGPPPPLRTPKLSHGTRCFVGAGGAGDFVLGIRQGEFFLFHPMCLSSKYSEFCGEFKNG